MNRRFKIAASSVLTLSMVLSMTACNQSAEQEEIITTNAEFAPLQEYVKDNVVDRYKAAIAGTINDNMTVEKKIKYLGWWPIDETQASLELFKQVYGIPEEGVESYGNQANSIIKYQSVAYADRYTQLTKSIQAGDSPDIFQFELANYPFTVWKNLFEPVDDYIDFSTSIWTDSNREAMKMVEWGGKNYCPVTSVNLNYVLWYRKSVVKEAGLEDPYDLFRAGKWDWNTFLDMCSKFNDPDNDRYCIDGWQVPSSFVCTTGTPIMSIEDGKLKSNMYDPNLERCVNTMITTLAKQNYRFPWHENGWSLNFQGWVIGDILFNTGLGNDIKDTFQTSIKTYEWEEGDIFCVPFPKDPDADKYYHSMKLDPWMLCSGSQNTSGYAALNCCFAAVSSDPETAERLTQINHEQLKTNYVGYSDEILDFLDELQGPNSPLTPVFEFKSGLGQDVVDGNDCKNPVDGLIEIPYADGLDRDGNPSTFTTWRNTYEGVIMDRVNEINNSIGA